MRGTNSKYPELWPMPDEDVEMLYEAIGITPEQLVEMKEEHQHENNNNKP